VGGIADACRQVRAEGRKAAPRRRQGPGGQASGRGRQAGYAGSEGRAENLSYLESWPRTAPAGNSALCTFT